MTKESRKKMSIAKRGVKRSKETREKISKGMKGHKTSKETKEKIKKSLMGHKVSRETRDKLRLVNLGKSLTDEHKEKVSKGLKAHKVSIKTRVKMSEAQKGNKGSNWKGGVTPENARIRYSIEYRLWREAVFARDNWVCQKTGIRGGELHAHHIRNFSDYPELRFAIDNGITLCEEAHHEFHKIYGQEENDEKQLAQWLDKVVPKKDV